MSDRGIGDNGGPTFEDVVRDNLDRGMLITIKEVIMEAIRDPRLERRHLRILAEVIDHINSKTGTAFPGRKTLSTATRRWNPTDGGDEDFGYTDAGISKTLSELVAFGYLIWKKKAGEQGGRALSHYSIRKPTIEELQQQITDFIKAQRAIDRRHPLSKQAQSVSTSTGKVTPTGKVTAESTSIGNVSHPESTSTGKVSTAESTSTGNVTSRRNVTSDFTSDFTSGGATVTRRKELAEVSESVCSAGAPASRPPEGPVPPPLPVYPDGNPGETHKGHGVYLNGSTIRHASFAVSLDGIRMNTINSGYTAQEITDRCLAHALQWAVEIEAGLLPGKVLPDKIANFLARSIMAEVNQSKIQGVREQRAREPFGGSRQVQPASSDGPAESKADRLRREAKERLHARTNGQGGAQ